MGQYYTPLTINEKDGKIRWSLQPKKFAETEDYSYYNGVKLMEHSWCGNSFTDFMSKYIYQNPTRIAWVGDYSDHLNVEAEGFENFYEDAWGKNLKKTDFDLMKRHFGYSGKFLVNHDTKEAFSLNYCGRVKPKDYDTWVIYPVSLLTAVGNGNGGGDYRGDLNYWNVGCWAGNLLSIEKKEDVPADYYIIDAIKFAE